jgi:cell shape-determining protein MreD
VPSLWLIAAWIDNTYSVTNNDRFILALTVIVTMFVLPVVAWILITAINTDFADLSGRRKGAVIATVGLFIVLGFAIGARNDMFLNCGDFKFSGNNLPANCVPVTPGQ